jgi:hypothetical protein
MYRLNLVKVIILLDNVHYVLRMALLQLEINSCILTHLFRHRNANQSLEQILPTVYTMRMVMLLAYAILATQQTPKEAIFILPMPRMCVDNVTKCPLSCNIVRHTMHRVFARSATYLFII